MGVFQEALISSSKTACGLRLYARSSGAQEVKFVCSCPAKLFFSICLAPQREYNFVRTFFRRELPAFQFLLLDFFGRLRSVFGRLSGVVARHTRCSFSENYFELRLTSTPRAAFDRPVNRLIGAVDSI